MDTQPLRLASALILLSILHAPATVLYVDLNSANPTPPYTNWATAATSVQDAVNAATAGDQILVTNGVYTSGGTIVYGSMSNRVAVTKPLTVQSVNGPAVTAILGYQIPSIIHGDSAVRCVYLTNGASLIGFTLSRGATRQKGDSYHEWAGAGVWCESSSATISNCVLNGNAAYWMGGGGYMGTYVNCTITANATTNRDAGYYGGGIAYGVCKNCILSGNASGGVGFGGGAYGSTLYNSAITGNSVGGCGGGAAESTLVNCTLTGNSALDGGGAYESFLTNCILYYNSAMYGPNSLQCTQSFCCTTPLPSVGVGNISSEPQLADWFHLSAGSPCRAAGNWSLASGTDVDGLPWANPPSIGCDEFDAGSATGPLSVSIQAKYGCD